jgi:hypothetical protein
VRPSLPKRGQTIPPFLTRFTTRAPRATVTSTTWVPRIRRGRSTPVSPTGSVGRTGRPAAARRPGRGGVMTLENKTTAKHRRRPDGGAVSYWEAGQDIKILVRQDLISTDGAEYLGDLARGGSQRAVAAGPATGGDPGRRVDPRCHDTLGARSGSQRNGRPSLCVAWSGGSTSRSSYEREVLAVPTTRSERAPYSESHETGTGRPLGRRWDLPGGHGGAHRPGGVGGRRRMAAGGPAALRVRRLACKRRLAPPGRKPITRPP